MREKDLTHVVAAMGGYSWSPKVDGRDGATCRPVPSSLDAEEAEAACLASDHRERRALAPLRSAAMERWEEGAGNGLGQWRHGREGEVVARDWGGWWNKKGWPLRWPSAAA